MEKQTDQQFKVEGMSCQHCVAAITRAVKELDSSAQVTVNLPAGLVRVASQVPAQELLRVLAEEGYPGTVTTG